MTPILVIQIVILSLNILASRRTEDVTVRELNIQVTLMWLPACCLGFIFNLLACKWSVFADFIILGELLAIGLSVIVVNKSDFIEEKTSERRQYSAQIFFVSYWVGCMFGTATWFKCFVPRIILANIVNLYLAITRYQM